MIYKVKLCIYMPYLAKFNLIKEKKYEKRKNNFLYHTFIRRHQSLTFKYEYINTPYCCDNFTMGF